MTTEADDKRKRLLAKIAALRPTLRTEVKEPRVLRFDPAGRSDRKSVV